MGANLRMRRMIWLWAFYARSKAQFRFTRIYPAFANSVDPDQLASEEPSWSEFTLFAIQYVNLYL